MPNYQEELLGKILIKNHLATESQVQECLGIQQQYISQNQYISLVDIMVEKQYITQQQADQVSNTQKKTTAYQTNVLYGLLAIKNNFVTKEQVMECVEFQKKQARIIRLGDIMVSKGYLTQQQHKALLQVQHRVASDKLTQVPISDDMLKIPPATTAAAQTEQQPHQSPGAGESPLPGVKEERNLGSLTTVLKATVASNDKGETKMLGELAVRRKLITLEQLQSSLRDKRAFESRGIDKSLGEIMRDKNYLSDEDLEALTQEIVIHFPRKDLIASYNIHGKIGQGAMGVVYKAEDINGRTVALKVLLPKFSNDEKFYKRFMREGYIATSLDHPNIVKAYDVGISDEYVYFSMEYVEGETVKKLLDRDYSIAGPYSLKIVYEIAKALKCAWQSNLVHRDIKPDNIIITTSGEVKLCDLGIAKEIDPENPHYTPTDKIMGTPYYISPELVRGDGEVDIRSDIYSLGATLYHMIVGDVPYDGESSPRIMVKHVLEKPVPPIQRRPDIPPEISSFIMRMMAKEVNKRFQNPTEIMGALLEIDPDLS